MRGSRGCPGVDPDAWPLCVGLRKAKWAIKHHATLFSTSLFTEQLSLTVVVIKQIFYQKFKREKLVRENLTKDKLA